MKMCSTLEVPSCITKCVLAIIYSNSFSHGKVDQKKTVAISQMFNHVQLHVHWVHLLNNRICRLVGCFGLNGPLRQYFSLYRAVFQREGERGKKG